MKVLVFLSRVFIGAVFAYSGFVKVVDPLGTTYKFVEYFQALGLTWLANDSFAFATAIVMCAAELIFGICLLLSIRPHISLWGVVLFMIMFTPLTLWLAITNAVRDCGCFGDAMKLTNWETFYKNVIIDVFVLILVAGRRHLRSYVKPYADWSLFAIVVIGTFGFEWYNYRHLPMVDYLPYKIGNNIPEKMAVPADAPKEIAIYYYTMKNLKDNTVKEISSEDYMKDSLYWNAELWEMDSEKTRGPIVLQKGYEPPIHDLSITVIEPEADTTVMLGDNVLQRELSHEGYTYWLVAYDLHKTDTEAFDAANLIAEQAQKQGHKFYCLTGSSLDDINKFRQGKNWTFKFYNADGTALKSIVRANPGLVLLKKGTVINKWHYSDFDEASNYKP